MKNERKFYALVLTCILVSAGLGVVVGNVTITDTGVTSGTLGKLIDFSNRYKPVNYIIYNESGTFICYNASSNTALFSGLNPTYVINRTLSSIKNSSAAQKSYIVLNGQFNMSQTIFLSREDYGDIVIRGDKCRFYYAGADPFFVLREDNLRITFDNIIFDAGSTFAAARNGANKIFVANDDVFPGNREVTFINCVFQDAINASIYYEHSNTDGLYIDNCVFEDNANGIFLNQSNPFNTITNCKFKSSNDFSIRSIGSSFIVDKCMFLSTPIIGNDPVGISNPIGLMVKITNSYFESALTVPLINLTSISPNSRINNLIITDNDFTSSGALKWQIYIPYIGENSVNTSYASLVIENNRFKWSTNKPTAYVFIRRCHAEATVKNNIVYFGVPLLYTSTYIEPISWVFRADNDNVTIDPFKGNITLKDTVNINNLLYLTPRAAAPLPGVRTEGMMFMSSSNHTAFIFDGTIWRALW